jgi:hypothetical protein
MLAGMAATAYVAVGSEFEMLVTPAFLNSGVVSKVREASVLCNDSGK